MKNYTGNPLILNSYTGILEYTLQTFSERSFDCIMSIQSSTKGWCSPGITRILWF